MQHMKGRCIYPRDFTLMALRTLERELRTTSVSRLNRTISCTNTVFMLWKNREHTVQVTTLLRRHLHFRFTLLYLCVSGGIFTKCFFSVEILWQFVENVGGYFLQHFVVWLALARCSSCLIVQKDDGFLREGGLKSIRVHLSPGSGRVNCLYKNLRSYFTYGILFYGTYS